MKTMKKTILFLLIVILNFTQNLSLSQNLVPNYSFEVYDTCPLLGNKIYYAPPWFQPSIHYGNTSNSSSSDFFDTCANSGLVGVPTNNLGFQQAKNGGQGYAGIYLNYDTLNYREYIEVRLDSALKPNKQYCVQFYVSSSFGTAGISNCGAYFSVDSLLDTTNFKTINVIPQVENPSNHYLSDTVNWMLVSGNFIAAGGERFMTIGNFSLPVNTLVDSSSSGFEAEYYYIDDVSVVYCDPSEVQEKSNAYQITLSPNPNSGNMQLNYHFSNNENGYVDITNMLGEKISSYKLSNGSTLLDIKEPQLESGIYFYQVYKNDTKIYSGKIVITK